MHSNYVLDDCKWANSTRSDVLYVLTFESEIISSVLIAIQHIVNTEFWIEQSFTIFQWKKVCKMTPILLIICVSHVSSQELVLKFNNNNVFPFMKQMKCDIWARWCSISSSDFIDGHLKELSLNLLVSVGIFFIRQKRPSISLRERKDPTIQLLYIVAKDKLENSCYAEDGKIEGVIDIVDQMKRQLQKIVRCSNDPSSSSKTKLRIFAEAGIAYLNRCKLKYSSIWSRRYRGHTNVKSKEHIVLWNVQTKN